MKLYYTLNSGVSAPSFSVNVIPVSDGFLYLFFLASFNVLALRGGGLDMNVEAAWDLGYSGKGVTVTILDDGVEWNHPDLADNYRAEASIDINANDKDPFPR